MTIANFLALAVCAFSTASSSLIPARENLNSTVGESESSPNPIGTLYPESVTGTLNGTVSMVPIPYGLARSIIPSEFNILTKAYEALLPGFPKDSYPLLIRAPLDHDLGINGVNLVPDFQSVHVSYPFVDALGDGYTSFQYQKYIILTSTNLIAIEGTAMYETTPIPATFNPDLNAYKYVHPHSDDIVMEAYAVNASSPTRIAKTRFTPLEREGRWPLSFYKNATNQPAFTNPSIGCDNQILFYNTTLSTGANEPVHIKGDVEIAAPYFPGGAHFKNIFGIKVDVAFIENNLVPCANLQGYHGTGPGDSGTA